MRSIRRTSHVLVFACLVGSAFAYPSDGKGKSKHDGDKHGKHAQKQAKKQAKKKIKAAQHDQHQHPAQTQDPQNRPPGWDKGKKVGWGDGSVPPGKRARHSRARQQELIREQQQRVIVYRQHLDQQRVLAQQYANQLQTDRRLAAYRYQQAYLARLQQQQNALRNNYDYNQDPYFYMAPAYSYNRDGSVHQTNQYGADQLRGAVNSGYSEGFRAGQADQQDRYSAGYQNSYAYQDANFGYSGYAGDQDTYNYYFRQGFSKGYDDGYNSRSQYGTAANGKYSILGNVLGAILKLQNLR